MTRSIMLVPLLVAALAGSAVAAPIMFSATLSGPAEEPPNASTGTGTALVTIDPVAHTLSVSVTFEDLISPSSVSHIHVINGPGDANLADTVGPVATTTPSFPGFPASVLAGTYDQTFDTTLASSFRPGFITDAGGLPQAEAALFGAIMEGRAYLNVHSSMFPAGEIRGFLAPVPEPATVLLLGVGAAGALARIRRQRARTRA